MSSSAADAEGTKSSEFHPIFTPLYDDDNPMPPEADLECWAEEGDEQLTRAELVAILELVQRDVNAEGRPIRPFKHVIRMVEGIRAEAKRREAEEKKKREEEEKAKRQKKHGRGQEERDDDDLSNDDSSTDEDDD